MKENLDVFDFELTPEEMQQIATLDTGHSCFTERNSATSVTEFLNAALTFQV